MHVINHASPGVCATLSCRVSMGWPLFGVISMLSTENLVSMARELEKLRVEMANAEKRARTSAAVANPGFNANYPQAGYPGNPYPPNYGTHPITMNPVGAENYSQYGPAPGPWGAYDMHRAQGPR